MPPVVAPLVGAAAGLLPAAAAAAAAAVAAAAADTGPVAAVVFLQQSALDLGVGGTLWALGPVAKCPRVPGPVCLHPRLVPLWMLPVSNANTNSLTHTVVNIRAYLNCDHWKPTSGTHASINHVIPFTKKPKTLTLLTIYPVNLDHQKSTSDPRMIGKFT